MAQWPSGRALDLRSLDHRFDFHRRQLRSNLGQVVHTQAYVPSSPSSINNGTGQRTVMFFGWEGDRRLGGKQRTAGDDFKSHLRADCLYPGVSSRPNAW